MIKVLISLMALLLSCVAWAAPQKIEMIFLSPQKVSMLLELIEKYSQKPKPAMFAQSEDRCMPMGEGCFHPQYGYMDKAPSGVESSSPSVPVAPKEQEELKLKTFNASEVNMVNCDKENYFDIFCGKEKPRARAAEVEVWFDVSSSLKSVDYNRDAGFCSRRTFAHKLQQSCKDKIRFSIYNTAIKEVGELSSVCDAYGTNDESRLLQWMKDSGVRKLLIVTDIDELSSPMRAFLDEKGAKMIGDGVKAFTAQDLEDYAREFARSCN